MVHISALNGDENMIRTLYLARANATIQDNEGIFLMDFANLMKKKLLFLKFWVGSILKILVWLAENLIFANIVFSRCFVYCCHQWVLTMTYENPSKVVILILCIPIPAGTRKMYFVF